MRGRGGHVGGAPGNAVRRPTCDLGHLVAVQSLHQRWLPIDRRCAVALLTVVIVAPCIHLGVISVVREYL